jgi:hypothetical protein
VDEKAYEDALKSIPPSSEKSDPWKSMRQDLRWAGSHAGVRRSRALFRTQFVECLER